MPEPRVRIRSGKALWLIVLTAVVLAGVAVAQMASATPNPPGNNGTVKIDGTPFDDLPNNEPHVGCTFQVDFYGYDEGDRNATVTFEAQPPTQRAGDDQVLLTDTVFIGEDDNSGGGSEAWLDASRTYTLDFTGIEPHPVQGFHVKLTINAEGSQGADVKHKVFWSPGVFPALRPPRRRAPRRRRGRPRRRARPRPPGRPPRRGQPRRQGRPRPPKRRPPPALLEGLPLRRLLARLVVSRPPRLTAGCCRSQVAAAYPCCSEALCCSAWAQ